MSPDLIRALEGLHDLVLVLDSEGICRHAGPYPLPPRVLREKPEASAGLSLTELLEPDLLELLTSVSREIEPGGISRFSYEPDDPAVRLELEAVRSDSGELTVLGRRRAKQTDGESVLDHAVLRQVLETIVAGICVLEASGTITYANHSAEAILGLSRCELTSRRHDSPEWKRTRTDGSELPYEELPFIRVMTTKQPVRDARLSIRRGDGTRVILSLNGAPVLNERGEVERVVFVIVDITKSAEQAETRERLSREMQSLARLESLAVLAGGVAHDFNNILVGLLGGAELVREQLGEDHPARPSVELMEQGARRASEMTHQLLSFSGKSRFVVGPRDLSELVRETSRLLESLISKDTQLVLSLAQDLPPVDIDSTQVSQVIMNMALNASQAMRSDGGVVTIATRYAEVDAEELSTAVQSTDPVLPGPFVLLEVSDDGIGMTPEVAAHVFEPFYTTKPQGHGLGLAAVMGVILSHKGFVQLRTAPGQGTSFSLGFPVARDAPPVVQAEKSAPESSFRGTVLVIDDEDFVRTITRRVLEHEGCEVLTAADGASGLALFGDHRDEIDAVVLDLTMPGMSGECVLAELRRIAPDLPVVVTSGYTDESPFASDPATRFLAKPFGRTSLLDALARL